MLLKSPISYKNEECTNQITHSVALSWVLTVL